MSKHKYITFFRERQYEFCQVRFVDGKGKTLFRKIFSVDKHGGREAVLVRAIAVRNKNAPRFGKALSESTQHARHQATPSVRNTTGVVGVSDQWPPGAKNPYISAAWSITLPGGTRKQVKKTRTYRNEKERKAALEWATKLRREMEKMHYKGKQ